MARWKVGAVGVEGSLKGITSGGVARERVIMVVHVGGTRARNHGPPIAVWPLTNIDIRATSRVRTHVPAISSQLG